MGKRSRKDNDDNEELSWEKKPRTLPEDENSHKKALLPIKMDDGTFVPQFLELQDNEEAGMSGEESEEEVVVEESKRKKIDFPKSKREIAFRRKRVIFVI